MGWGGVVGGGLLLSIENCISLTGAGVAAQRVEKNKGKKLKLFNGQSLDCWRVVSHFVAPITWLQTHEFCNCAGISLAVVVPGVSILCRQERGI